MASAYRPFSPATGPGNTNYIMPPFNLFQQLNYGVMPGYAFTSSLGPNNTPNPGPPAPATDNGILLEPSWSEFIELEPLDGWLTLE